MVGTMTAPFFHLSLGLFPYTSIFSAERNDPLQEKSLNEISLKGKQPVISGFIQHSLNRGIAFRRWHNKNHDPDNVMNQEEARFLSR